jgi:hypothetical protein
VPLRAVTITIASFSLTVVFGTAATHGVTFLGLEPIMSRLIQHMGMLIGGYSLIAFYLFSALDQSAARRQAMRQAIPLAIAAVAMIAVTVLMPSEIRTDAAMLAFARPGSKPLDEFTIRMLYLIPNAYMGFAFASALLWTRRYAKGAERWLRQGLALTSVGLAGIVIGETVFVVTTSAQWAGLAVPLWLFIVGLLALLPGSVIFMIGFAYPAVRMRLAALGVWWQHRRIYYRLAPLWTLLHQQFPEDTLGRVPSGRWRDRLSLRGMHRRYYRRVIECRDGLVRVSPYLAANGDDSSLADQVRAGLRARASGLPAPNRPIPLAIPAGDGLDADVQELVSLSEALRRNRDSRDSAVTVLR